MLWVSFITNVLIVIMVAFSSYSMFVGWDFMGKKGALEGLGFEMFRYYTIDSNILMGICSLIMAINEGYSLLGKTAELPSYIYGVKLMGTSVVMLTFLVTVFFLVPQFKDPKELFYNSNLFFHAIVPVMAFLSFIFLERTRAIPFKMTFLAIIPTLIYAVYYVGEIFRHLDNGKVDKKYDFYDFTRGRKEAAPIAGTAVILIAYMIVVILWILNRI